MTNNDILRRLRYALRINDKNMIVIFKLGGVKITEEEVTALLTKDIEMIKSCSNRLMNDFLTGLITYKRGIKKDQKIIEEEISSNKNINNLILRKLRIALAFRSEDMIETFKDGGINMSDSELSAIFRRKDHKNYKEAGDKYIRVFLKGLTIQLRGER